MSRPPRTKARKLTLAKASDERAELNAVRADRHRHCYACNTGVHDPGYDDDGVCRCRCCSRDMTDEGFPWLRT